MLQERMGESAIVYCLSRRETETVAATLRDAGIEALPYHAGLEHDQRRRTHDRFTSKETPVIVATIAFGMGIDVPDIRLIVHYNLPKSLEGYYQETGRAGRDGEPSDCVLFYTTADRSTQEGFLVEIEDPDERERAFARLRRVLGYCQLRTCRRRHLLDYFGERTPDGQDGCGNCDNCLDPESDLAEFDGTEIAQKILSAVHRTGARFGMAHVTEVLRGSRSRRVLQFGHDKLSVHGIVREFAAEDLRDLADQLVDRGLLVRAAGEYPTVSIFTGRLEVPPRPRTDHPAPAPERPAGPAEGPGGGARREDIRDLRARGAARRTSAGDRDGTVRDAPRRPPRTRRARQPPPLPRVRRPDTPGHRGLPAADRGRSPPHPTASARRSWSATARPFLEAVRGYAADRELADRTAALPPIEETPTHRFRQTDLDHARHQGAPRRGPLGRRDRRGPFAEHGDGPGPRGAPRPEWRNPRPGRKPARPGTHPPVSGRLWKPRVRGRSVRCGSVSARATPTTRSAPCGRICDTRSRLHPPRTPPPNTDRRVPPDAPQTARVE